MRKEEKIDERGGRERHTQRRAVLYAECSGSGAIGKGEVMAKVKEKQWQWQWLGCWHWRGHNGEGDEIAKSDGSSDRGREMAVARVIGNTDMSVARARQTV